MNETNYQSDAVHEYSRQYMPATGLRIYTNARSHRETRQALPIKLTVHQTRKYIFPKLRCLCHHCVLRNSMVKTTGQLPKKDYWQKTYVMFQTKVTGNWLNSSSGHNVILWQVFLTDTNLFLSFLWNCSLLPQRPLFDQGLQRHNSPADWARELCKPSTDSASLWVEKMFSFWVWGSLGGTLQAGMFLRFFGQLYQAPGPNPMSQFLAQVLF